MSASDFDRATVQSVNAAHQAIAALAKSEHAKIMDADPRPSSFTRHVDGVLGAPEESVKDGGVIVYDYGRMDFVADLALTVLRELSPVLSGDYVRSHTIFLNGRPVDSVKDWKPGDDLAIANTMPYARKIEIGKAGFRAHPEVYEKAERMISRQIGGIANVKFGYMSVDAGDIGAYAMATALGVSNRRARHASKSIADWLRRQPALFLSPA